MSYDEGAARLQHCGQAAPITEPKRCAVVSNHDLDLKLAMKGMKHEGHLAGNEPAIDVPRLTGDVTSRW